MLRAAVMSGVIHLKPILGIDIETYSPAPLPKTGVYRYVDSDEFEILLFSYAYDDGPVRTVDLASGEHLPDSVLADLENPGVIKAAYNAQFERVCLSKYLGHWLDPHQWRCTAVMAAYLTMPARLADAAVALGGDEAVVLLGRETRHRLEPVRKMSRPVLDRPLFHDSRNRIGHIQFQVRAILDGLVDSSVDILGQAFSHDPVTENKTAVYFRNRCSLLHNVSSSKIKRGADRE